MIFRLILALIAGAAFTACSKSDQAQPAPTGAADDIGGAVPMPSAPLDQSKTLTRIVFASCAQQNEDQSIWDQIAAENPDLTLYIGDQCLRRLDPE